MKSFLVENILAKPAIEYDGNPSIEVEVELCDGTRGSALGKLENIDIATALKTVNEKIAGELVGENASRQSQIDSVLKELDGTPNLTHLNSSVLFTISMAVCRASSASIGLSLCRYLGGIQTSNLTLPIFTVVSGGSSDLRWEILLIPKDVNDLSTSIENCRTALMTINPILTRIERTQSYEKPLATIKEHIKKSKEISGIEIGLGIFKNNNDIITEEGRVAGNNQITINHHNLLSIKECGTVSDLFDRAQTNNAAPVVIAPKQKFHGVETFGTDFAVASHMKYIMLDSLSDWPSICQLNRLLHLESETIVH